MAKPDDHQSAISNSYSESQHDTNTQQSSAPLPQQLLNRSVSPSASPPFPTHHHHRSQSSTRSIHVADISYPDFFMRTPVATLPFPHPRWHVRPSTTEVSCEVTTPIPEEYGAQIGYMDSVGQVRESIESGGGVEVSRVWRGYVEHKESGERWCLSREGKRCFDGEGDAPRKKSRGSL